MVRAITADNPLSLSGVLGPIIEKVVMVVGSSSSSVSSSSSSKQDVRQKRQW